MAQRRVLTAVAHRECRSPGGAAEGISQQTAGADQPWACAQVSGQVGEEGPCPDNQPASWGLSTLGMFPLPSSQFPLTTSYGLLGLA